MKDWFHKEPLKFNVDLIKEDVFHKIEGVSWQESHPSQAPGSVWCLIQLEQSLHANLEKAAHYKIFPDFYVWNYKSVKRLLIHKDTNDPGEMRNIVGVIPLIGRFRTEIYDDNDLEKPIDFVEYGPGEILFLNNTKYYHGGLVLSETRLSLHFYFDFFNTANEPLDVLLKKNRIL